MTAFATNGSFVPRGIGDVNHYSSKFTVPSAMVSSDTIVVTVGDANSRQGPPKDAVPMAIVGVTRSGNVYTAVTGLSFTSHDRSTGQTTLTAGGNIAAGTTFLLHYGCIG
jgi:hypothetical protein